MGAIIVPGSLSSFSTDISSKTVSISLTAIDVKLYDIKNFEKHWEKGLKKQKSKI